FSVDVTLQYVFFFSSRRRHTRSKRDWSSDVCSSDLPELVMVSDPQVDEQAVIEATNAGIAVIAISNTDNVTSKVDLVIPANNRRSEEHTSELQSRFDLVCRLLLEKKK